MDFEIRDFRPADRPQVLALAPRLTSGMAPWRDAEALTATTRSWVEGSTADDSDGHAIVAESDGAVIGFISLSTMRHFSGETDGYIGELMVAESAEGHGVGRALVAAAERRAIEAGHRCLTLTTGAANGRALSLYERLGFAAEDVNLTKVLTSGG